MSEKTAVCILFGGKSVEHAVSINSAKNINEFIDKNTFDVVLIGIAQNGQWFLKDTVDGNFDQAKPIYFSLDPDDKGFINKQSGEKIDVEVVFPILHGTDGEDGNIQGMLTAMEIPFVGTGVLGSAISMNKLYGKRLMNGANIPTSKFLSYTSDQQADIDFQAIVDEIGLPFMVKAANLGSSVGIFKIKEEAQFKDAIAEVFGYDHTLLCEAFVDGRELECSVMGNEKPEASLPGEIIVNEGHEFYTYEAKYLDPDAATLKVPAEVDSAVAERIREFSIMTYKALHCEDFARVDLFLKKDGTVLVNEINTIPGFTNSSMFPMMWKERGISFTELITKLINMALKRFKKNQQLVKTYKPA